MTAPTTKDTPLTDLQQRFVVEYLKDLNATAAVRRSGSLSKYPSTTANEMLAKPQVQEALVRAHAERNATVKVEAAEILRHVLAAATVDPNEITQVRRGCCRHCHGVEHRYQYTDERELGKGRRAFEASEEGLVEAFEHGGTGFDPKREPVATCTGCGGEGSAYVHINDTRNLSPAARSLFAGAKQTKDGIEVKLHSQDKSRELLLRHLGLLNDKLEVKGDLGEAILAARKRVRGR